MPCRSDYLAANEREIELSKVYAFLDEIRTGELDKSKFSGYDQRAYNKADQDHLDKKTAELCSCLRAFAREDLSSFSLELQMWWRDHQIADLQRELDTLRQNKEYLEKQEALSKLTDREKKLLGLI